MTGKRTEKLQVSLSDEELSAIDEWRFEMRMPSRAAAIRQLIHVGLHSIKTGKDIAGDPIHSSSRDIGVLETPHDTRITTRD